MTISKPRAETRSPHAESAQPVDPVTRQLIRGSLRAARLECELIIERTAMSAFIREKKDYTVSFLDAGGREIYGDTMGSDILGCVWDYYPVDAMRTGDLYWYNDPYLSHGSITHTPDMVFIAPVFFHDEVVAYCHSFAHFWDLGGSRPGSIGPANTEIFHDGTLVPPIKIIDAGNLNDEAYRIILRNSRYPDLLEGDSRALMSAANRAQERLLEMFERFGRDTMLAAIAEDQADTGRLVRDKTLEMIPEGEYSVRDYMDHAGVSEHWHSFHLKLIRRGNEILLDATDSDDQADGSINFIASDGALKAYFGQYFHQFDASLMANHGLLAGIDDVQLRQGSILRPEWPAALGCRAHTFTKLKSAVRAVVAQATEGKVMAAAAVYVIAYWRMKESGRGTGCCAPMASRWGTGRGRSATGWTRFTSGTTRIIPASSWRWSTPCGWNAMPSPPIRADRASTGAGAASSGTCGCSRTRAPSGCGWRTTGSRRGAWPAARAADFRG